MTLTHFILCVAGLVVCLAIYVADCQLVAKFAGKLPHEVFRLIDRRCRWVFQVPGFGFYLWLKYRR